MNTTKRIKEEIYYLLRYGEEKTLYDKNSYSLLEILKKEREIYDLKKEFSNIAYKYMKKELDFITFYFRYNINNSYDTVISLDYDEKNKLKREVTLTYNDGIFKILNSELLTLEEKKLLEDNKCFYEQLTKFGVEQNYPKQSISTVSRNFSIDLSNNYLELTSPVYKVFNLYIYLNYAYNQIEQRKIMERREKSLFTNTNKLYETKEGIIEFNTNMYKIKKTLTKDNGINIIEFLDSIQIYEEELPERLNNYNIKKRKLIKSIYDLKKRI